MFGAEAWEHAQRLWAKLRPKVKSEPAVQQAVEEAAGHPDDARLVSALEYRLEQLLKGDPELAAELGHVWKEGEAARVAVASGDRSAAMAGDVSDSIIVTGDHVTIGDDEPETG